MLIDSNPGVYMPKVLKESINSPHDIYLPGNLKESKSETSKIIARVLEHTKPSSAIFDIAEPLNASLAAQYPKARHVTSYYFPKIKSKLGGKDIYQASCIVRTYVDSAKNTDTQKRTRSSTEYYVNTAWQLPTRKNSLENTIYLKIRTTEHSTLSICNLPSEIIHSRKGSNLGQTHPTFDIHQKVAEYAVPFLMEEEDTAPLRLARLLFGLADEQSPCKRITRVVIDMKLRTKGTEKPSSCMAIDRVQYEQAQNSRLAVMLPDESHRVYIALGSNVGDRIGNLESACHRMHDRGIKVTRTSALYETKAMYLEDQQSFINGACEVSCAYTGMYLH